VLPVQHEPRDEPCARCAAPVALRVITDFQRRRLRHEPIHEDDGSAADASCRRPRVQR
jgi:hypothetical protein